MIFSPGNCLTHSFCRRRSLSVELTDAVKIRSWGSNLWTIWYRISGFSVVPFEISDLQRSIIRRSYQDRGFQFPDNYRRKRTPLKIKEKTEIRHAPFQNDQSGPKKMGVRIAILVPWGTRFTPISFISRMAEWMQNPDEPSWTVRRSAHLFVTRYHSTGETITTLKRFLTVQEQKKIYGDLPISGLKKIWLYSS